MIQSTDNTTEKPPGTPEKQVALASDTYEWLFDRAYENKKASAKPDSIRALVDAAVRQYMESSNVAA